MLRGGPATAADHPHPQGQHPVVVKGHLGRRGREDRLALLQDRQPGVGLGNQRQAADRAHLLQQGEDALGTQPAVGTDHVGPQGLEGHRGRFRRRAEHAAPAVVESHLGNDRQRGEFPAGHHGSPQFADIEKGFAGDQIGAGPGESGDLLAENLHHLIEPGIPHRFEKAAGRPDGGGHQAVGPGGCPGDIHGPRVNLGGSALEAVMGQLVAAAAKGVGYQDIGSGLGIFAMNPLDHLGGGQVHLLGAAAGLETTFLQQRPHGAIQHQDPLFDRLNKIGH